MVTDAFYWVFASLAILAVVFLACGCAVLRERRKSKNYVAALEQASDFIGNGLVFFNDKDVLISANGQAHDFLPDLLGLDSQELQGKGLCLQDFLNYFYDHAVDCDQSLLNALGRSAERHGDVGFREVVMASENRFCLVESQKIYGVGTNLILIDFGDIRNQEEVVLRLNQYNHELSQAIQASTIGIVITKPLENADAQTAVFANNAFCGIFDCKRDAIIGKDIHDIFMRIDDDQAVKKIRKVSASRVTGNVEVRIQHPQEGERWYDLKLTPVQDYAGKVELFIVTLNDMTELKIREAEFSQTQKLEALGQLAAGVAHDFNNILSIIDGYARITVSQLDDKDQVEASVERIRTAAQRGASLVKQMLTFSRHEIVDDTVIDLGKVLHEQEMLLRPLLDASIKCKVLVDHEDMYIECPQDNLTQIMMNLVVNARDAMPQGGTLLIESRVCPRDTLPKVLLDKDDEQAYASLRISDTWMGIPQEVLDRIFDPFFTTKQQGKGSGLGLSMVYGLVKQIGGYIDVETVAGQGTTMIVYFPLTDAVPRQISGDADDLSSIRFDGYTALVAEDEPDLLELVSGMLEELGMNVLRARDGHEALAVQDDYDGRIDLLLSDVVMPELNGVGLADLLKELRPDVKVIFMSGYPAKGQMAPVEIPDDALFIAKPIEHDILIKLVFSKLSEGGGGVDDLQTPRWASKAKDVDLKESGA